jgi:hypothetical protein
MDIGKEERTIIVEPVKNPVPVTEPAPAREPERTPAKPRREREKVPA